MFKCSHHYGKNIIDKPSSIIYYPSTKLGFMILKAFYTPFIEEDYYGKYSFENVFNEVRHTFASQLVMAGVALTTVKELLGHKTLAMTLRYSHLAPEHKTKAVKVLDKALNGDTIGTKLAQ